MMRFLRFITEMPISVHTDPDDIESHMLDDDSIRPAGKYDREEHVGDVHGYSLHARSWKSPDAEHERHPPYHYLAVHDHSDAVHMSVRGGTTPDNHFIANDTKKHPDCDISAPEMYHAILHAGIHKGIQSGDEQTEGGKSIWKRLHHEHHDVEVTHHDAETGNQIHLHTGDDWHKNYDQTKETHFRVKLKA